MMGKGERHRRGFTLLEVLVVVAIGAIVTGLVVLRVGDWPSPQSPERQLERLSALIGAQCEQAMFQSRSRGVRMTEEGYDFWQSASDEGWVPLPDQGLSRSRDWLGEASVELDVAGHQVPLADESEAPQLVCEPLGELSAFTLSLSVGEVRMRLIGERNGRRTLEQH